jgi:hypothetical protein
VSYIKRNKDQYQCIFEDANELEDYIRMIERDRAWGGELEMSIISKIHQCGFLIHASGRPNISVFFSSHLIFIG